MDKHKANLGGGRAHLLIVSLTPGKPGDAIGVTVLTLEGTILNWQFNHTYILYFARGHIGVPCFELWNTT
jgi:hypothetical protein